MDPMGKANFHPRKLLDISPFFQLPGDVYPELPETVIRACSRPRNSKFQPPPVMAARACAMPPPRLVASFLGWKVVWLFPVAAFHDNSNVFFFPHKCWRRWNFGEGEKILQNQEENTLQNGKGPPFWDLRSMIFSEKKVRESSITPEYHIVYAYRFCLELMVRNKQRQQKNETCHI